MLKDLYSISVIFTNSFPFCKVVPVVLHISKQVCLIVKLLCSATFLHCILPKLQTEHSLSV